MAKALLINKDDIPKKTLVNGNVDTDLFVQYIEIAQDIAQALGMELKLMERRDG